MKTRSENFNPRTVSSTYLQAFVYGAIKVGVSPDIIFGMIEGGQIALDNPVKRFSNETLIDILNKVVEITGDRSVGLRIGLNFRQEHFLDVGYALPYAQTLRDAHELNVAYQPLTQQIGKTSVEIKNGHTHMYWTSNSQNIEYEKYYTESIFAGYASIGRWLLMAQDNPCRAMRFRHKAPEDINVYHVVFGDDVIFEAERDEIVFDEDLMSARMPTPNPEMFNLLKEKLARKFIDLNQPPSTSLESTRLIQTLLPEEDFSINLICDRLGMSERTLRRRLAEEGTSFRDILSNARQELCEIYFRQERSSLAQIAHDLGFQDQSAFSRAFKQWHGMTPRQYRAEIKSGTMADN